MIRILLVVAFLILVIIIALVVYFISESREKKALERGKQLDRFSECISQLEEKKSALNEHIESLKGQLEKLSTSLDYERQMAANEVKNIQSDKARQLEEVEKDFEVKKGEYHSKLVNIRDTYLSVVDSLNNIAASSEGKEKTRIQMPPNYINDINYLLDDVVPRISNKDVILKLIWQEYFQKPAKEMLNNIGAKDAPGIYKITNLLNGKCYIGKSTKVASRITDHIKGAIGISSISDQKIHQEMRKEGIWNFYFEVLCECPREQLSEKEKFFIEFYKSQTYGYNVKAGG